ncbi:NADAR domain-containing protein [Actinocorallia lasiicapitis]
MEARSVADVVRLEAAGIALKYLYFWGHEPTASGNHVFSQWFQRDFTENGVRYASAEHYMMAAKARLFGDSATEAAVLAAGHPRQAKELGRQVAPFDQAIWDAERFEIVVSGSVAKFKNDADLRGHLLATGQRVLVEASPLDRIWGIGLGATDERAGRPTEWDGLNLLGFALMEARARVG